MQNHPCTNCRCKPEANLVSQEKGETRGGGGEEEEEEEEEEGKEEDFIFKT